MAAALALWICLCPLSAEATTVGDSLVIGIQVHKTSFLDPLFPIERDMLSVYDLVYESLITIDDNYNPQPLLAERWDMSGNGKTWTFYLRDDVTFSDGTPLTAHDVVDTANYIISRAKDDTNPDKGYYCNLRYFVKEIRAKSDYVVEVRADRPYYGVLYAMTFPVLPSDKIGTNSPPGTGAYIIDDFTSGSTEVQGRLHLSVNPYWRDRNPQVKEITFSLFRTSEEVVNAYQYARVDTIFSRSIAVAQYKSSSSTLAIDYRTNQLECILLNNYLSSMTTNMRQAIRCAVDVDKIVQSVYMGMVDRTDTPFINGTWMYNSTLSSYFAVDQQKARELIAADGWIDTNENGYVDKPNEDDEAEDLTYTIIVYEEPDNSVRVETANMVSQMLAQVGIASKVETLSFAAMQDRLKNGNYHIAIVSYAMDICPDAGFMLMRGNTGNHTLYRSNDMNSLCKKLREQATKEGYQEVLWQIQELFAKDCPFICMFYRGGTVLTRKMYTTTRDVREYQLLDGIESFFD